MIQMMSNITVNEQQTTNIEKNLNELDINIEYMENHFNEILNYLKTLTDSNISHKQLVVDNSIKVIDRKLSNLEHIKVIIGSIECPNNKFFSNIVKFLVYLLHKSYDINTININSPNKSHEIIKNILSKFCENLDLQLSDLIKKELTPKYHLYAITFTTYITCQYLDIFGETFNKYINHDILLTTLAAINNIVNKTN